MKTRSGSRRDRVGALLGVLALVGFAGLGTSALFTDNAEVTTEARTGTLQIGVGGGAEHYLLDDINRTVFAPGVSASQVVALENIGDPNPIDALVDITSELSGDADILGDRLTVRVEEVADDSGTALDGGPNVLFDTAHLDTLQLDDVELAADGADQTRYLQFTVAMPEAGDATAASGDNVAQGKSVTIELTALAEQNLTAG